MDIENYRILQVSEDASDEEITRAYEALKRKYDEEKWQDGEAGMNAARMLTKIEAAYNEILAERREKTQGGGTSSAYEEVAAAIRSGDLTRAQQLLDGFNERGAEWHYLQSVVFFKKNWLNESKKQLEIAMQIEPSNPKYSEAYRKLNERTQYRPQTGGAPSVNPDPSSGGEQMGGGWCANCASACYTFLCVNLIFNLCCNCR